MEEALKHSRLVACLFSSAYLDPRWCGEEWQAALDKEKLLPLRIAGYELDCLLSPRAYVDLVGVAETEAQERIVAALKMRDEVDPRPKAKPAFPQLPSQQRARTFLAACQPTPMPAARRHWVLR
jgi:hypothetical protein